MSRSTDHYPPQPPPPATGHPAHHHAHPSSGAAPSSFPPLHNPSVSHVEAAVAPHHSIGITLPKILDRPSGPSQQQRYPTNSPHGPPMQFPSTTVKTDIPSEHGYSADRSGHATPVTRHPSEFPPLPPQRTPSTPAQPHHLPQSHTADRPMEGAPHGYSAPHEQAPQYPPQYHQPGHALVPIAHPEQQPLPHMQPVIDPNGYAPAPGPYPGHAYTFYSTLQGQGANKRRAARATRVSGMGFVKVDSQV